MPKLAFDHEKIIQTALNDLKSGLLFELIGHSNEEFTLLKLQNIYLANPIWKGTTRSSVTAAISRIRWKVLNKSTKC